MAGIEGPAADGGLETPPTPARPARRLRNFSGSRARASAASASIVASRRPSSSRVQPSGSCARRFAVVTSSGVPKRSSTSGRRSCHQVYSRASGRNCTRAAWPGRAAPTRAARCPRPWRNRTGRSRTSAKRPCGVTHSIVHGPARMACEVRRNAAAPRAVSGSTPKNPSRRKNGYFSTASAMIGA
ncbi:MAG TPA: hypothetical protein PKE47_00250 [Verrucomicrobiota bacterium]|nr:hypothetical protein [Verrucomicrobiota bacterium]